MRFLRLLFCLAMAVQCSPASAETPLSPAVPVTQDVTPFNDLDKFFVKQYSQLAIERSKTKRPLLVALGFIINLYCEDGSVKTTAGNVQHFDELKSVAHIGACLYPIGVQHWQNPADQTWLETMASCKEKIDAAMAKVDDADWSSEAWPDGQNKLKDFMKASLKKASDFTGRVLATKQYSREDYAKFCQEYESTMSTAFYLSALGDTYATLKTLNKWKQEIGDEKWSQMYAVVAGSQGRTTAGLTTDSNPLALTFASLMTKEQAADHIIMAPGASTMDQALAAAGMTMNAVDLAQTMFPTREAQKSSGFYAALKSFDKPVALSYIREVLKTIPEGTAKDPVLGLGPKP